MCVTLSNEVLSVDDSGTDVVLSRFPSSSDLTSFGLTPSVIKTIAIPNDLQEWPTTALDGCTNLEKITTFGMPAKEATIELSVDHGLRNLTKLTFLRLPSTIQKIADGFYSDDGSGNIFPRSLQSVSFQDCSSLESIGNYAFYMCSLLTSLDLSGCSSLQSIGRYSFSTCSLLTSLDLSGCSLLQSIERGAWAECWSIAYLNLLGCSSLQKIGEYAFCRNKPLVQLDLSNCPLLQSIEEYAFYSNTYLVQIDLSNCPLLRSIGGCAFYSNTSLVQLDLSNCPLLQSIGGYAFQYCSKLQTAILPASLTTIEKQAFLGTALKTVYWMGSGPAANIGSNAFPSGVEHVYNYKP